MTQSNGDKKDETGVENYTLGWWKIADTDGGIYHKIFKHDSDCKGYPIAKVLIENKFVNESSRANAEFIVRATGNHEALICELEKYYWFYMEKTLKTDKNTEALLQMARGENHGQS